MYGHFMKLQSACGLIQHHSKDAQYGSDFLAEYWE